MREEHTLNETGKRGMIVIGEKIVDDTTRKGRDDGRWFRIQVIQADDGYVIGTALSTKYRGEHDHYWIDETKNKRSIMKVLESHIPEADSSKEDEIELRKEYIDMIDRIEETIQSGQAKPIA